jgi:uncharacterized protein YigA (DUF484 family)
MARKRDDAALAEPLPTEQQVARFLQLHPDFLIRHPELLVALSPPSRWSEEDGVVDMQVFMIDRLRDEVERVKGTAEHVLHTSRSNMSIQNRTHQAVVALLEADALSGLAEAVSDDLPAILDVDIAVLAFEGGDAFPAELAVPGVTRLPAGAVEKVMGGADRDCALAEEMPGDPALFGEGHALVQSSAVVRLVAADRRPPGVLALGSRHGRTFHAGQGTELLSFLARVIESCLGRFVA